MNEKDKKLLLELICNEQIHMIIKDNTKYESERYKKLEELKIKIKDMELIKWQQYKENICTIVSLENMLTHIV